MSWTSRTPSKEIAWMAAWTAEQAKIQAELNALAKEMDEKVGQSKPT
jgi:hypothetical protein